MPLRAGSFPPSAMLIASPRLYVQKLPAFLRNATKVFGRQQ
jgi:hypothetical protein